MRKLNIGCGNTKKEGFIGIDLRDYGQELVRDITRGLPFDDDSVDEIFSSHTLEHIERADVPFVWEEMYRVLKHGCRAKIIVPHAKSPQAFMMAHLSYWLPEVVQVLCNQWGSPDHFTKTKWTIERNEMKGEELYITLLK